jgi:hypothetical protein
VQRIGLIVALLLGASLAAAPATAPAQYGQIKAARVIGEVDAIDPTDHSITPLHNDDLLYQGYSIRTAAESSIILVFSNGATVRLGPETEISIAEFMQDPFAESELAVGTLTREPTRSTTRLRLTKGELLGEVPKLHAGSTHVIDTPVGAAGIRGTTFRHAYHAGANGSAQFASACGEGEVIFTGKDGKIEPLVAGRELDGRASRRGRLQSSVREISRHSRVALDHHVRVMRTIRAQVRFKRSDTRAGSAQRPPLRRDPAARREQYNDFKEIEAEEQERAKQEEKAAPPPKPEREPKEKAPKAPKKTAGRN